jgi:hypothetical protein
MSVSVKWGRRIDAVRVIDNAPDIEAAVIDEEGLFYRMSPFIASPATPATPVTPAVPAVPADGRAGLVCEQLGWKTSFENRRLFDDREADREDREDRRDIVDEPRGRGGKRAKLETAAGDFYFI